MSKRVQARAELAERLRNTGGRLPHLPKYDVRAAIDLGYSTGEIADYLGVTISTAQRWADGFLPNCKDQKLVYVLNKTRYGIADLLEENDRPTPYEELRAKYEPLLISDSVHGES